MESRIGIKQLLNEFRKKLDKHLENFFDRKISQASEISPLVSSMVKNLREFTLRPAKRVRAAFCYYGYLACGGKNKKAALEASMFIELIHSYLLIHDDIIDRDEFRRGKATMHNLYKKIYRSKSKIKDAEHFGVSMAIMAGDLASALGYEILIQSRFPDTLKLKALAKLNQSLFDVDAGQILDEFLEINSKPVLDDVLTVFKYKTNRYTVEGPLHIGAILGEADLKILNVFSRYSLPLGIAFQIQDDILGMFGSAKKIGKPVGSDLREGKQTILIVKALERADKRQKKIIISNLRKKKITREDLQKVRKIIIDTGSLDYSKRLALRLTSQAKEIIKKTPLADEGKIFLEKIPDYIVARDH